MKRCLVLLVVLAGCPRGDLIDRAYSIEAQATLHNLSSSAVAYFHQEHIAPTILQAGVAVPSGGTQRLTRRRGARQWRAVTPDTTSGACS